MDKKSLRPRFMNSRTTARDARFQVLFPLLFFILFGLLFPYSSRAVDAEDIIIVYNKKMEGSLDVARHYAAMRQVPAENLLGLALTDKETISRDEYDTVMIPPLRAKAEEFLSRQRRPLLLLVHGVPLRVGSVPVPETPGVVEGKAEKEALRTASLAWSLSTRLLTIMDPAYVPPAFESNDAGAVIQKSMDLSIVAVSRMAAWQKKDFPTDPARSVLQDEAASIFFRLVGLTPLARNMATEADNKDVSSSSDRNRNGLSLWGKTLENRISLTPFHGIVPETVDEMASLWRAGRGLTGELLFWKEVRKEDFFKETSASVDSELTLLLAPFFAKARWLPNPFLPSFDKNAGIDAVRLRTVLISRLDGPTPAIAKRLVDDAMEVEKTGLDGVFYIDARWPADTKNTSEYAKFDAHLHTLHDIVRAKSSLKVVLDDNSELFTRPCCPNGALYCGWYSLGKYVDGVEWKKGSVGYHVASGEAGTLRNPEKTVWCKRMLEEGVAATIGPVQEPYLNSFPRPDHFFPLLMTGKLPLVEVYFRTIPFLSWRQVLVGDPLYNPFREKSVINSSDEAM